MQTEEKDIERTCVEASCLQPFVIEVGEQAFHADHGLELPKRCKDCRKKRRAKQS